MLLLGWVARLAAEAESRRRQSLRLFSHEFSLRSALLLLVRSRARWPALLVAVLALAPAHADAARRRATFFPKDLDMEQPGDAELDTRIGILHTADNSTLVSPDFALDLGIDRRLELDLDGQAGVDWATGNWLAQDQLWFSTKHLLWDSHGKDNALAFGLQQGPRFAVMPNTWGFGYQALGLLGIRATHWQGVLSLGGFVDPMEINTFQRPIGVLGGIDWSFDLNDDWDIAPSLAFTLHGEGNLDTVATVDLEVDLGAFGSARAGVIAGWQDSGRVIGMELGYAPRVNLWHAH